MIVATSLTSVVKRLLKRLMSFRFFKLGDEHFNRELSKQLAGKSPREAFTLIYEQAIWGSDRSGDFFSGEGSHDAEFVNCYVEAITNFLKTFSHKPDVVDLGCGDFNVGMQVRAQCGQYVACDVVPALIQRNRKVFCDLDVDFRCIDITEEPLPDGEIVFFRQVLQHLNNSQISSVVEKLGGYKYLVLTEHLPSTAAFEPNVDKPLGWDTRVRGVSEGEHRNSGVILTLPPFNLHAKSECVICEVADDAGIVRTTVYQLN